MCTICGKEFGADLVLHADDCGSVWCYEVGVNSGASIGHVVGKKVAGIVGCREETNPVGSVGGRVAGVRRVAERV